MWVFRELIFFLAFKFSSLILNRFHAFFKLSARLNLFDVFARDDSRLRRQTLYSICHCLMYMVLLLSSSEKERQAREHDEFMCFVVSHFHFMLIAVCAALSWIFFCIVFFVYIFISCYIFPSFVMFFSFHFSSVLIVRLSCGYWKIE